MKNFEDFLINENTDSDKRDVYIDALKKLCKDNDLYGSFTVDTQGYVLLLYKVDFSTSTFSENSAYTKNIDKTISILKFLKELQSKSVQTYETYGNGHSFVHMTFDFRDLKNIDPYFKSLVGINKYNL